MLLRFRTDSSVTHGGFKAKFSIGRPDGTRRPSGQRSIAAFMEEQAFRPEGTSVTSVLVSPQAHVEEPT